MLLNHIFIGQGSLLLVKLWKRNLLTLITPAVARINLHFSVCSGTLGFCSKKAALTDNRCVTNVQLLFNYNFCLEEHHVGANTWVKINGISCEAESPASWRLLWALLMARNCPANLLHFFTQAFSWCLLNYTLATADRGIYSISSDLPWLHSEQNITELLFHLLFSSKIRNCLISFGQFMSSWIGLFQTAWTFEVILNSVK